MDLCELARRAADDIRPLAEQKQLAIPLDTPISKRLSEALGGRISVHTEVGRGSTFRLWLPLEPAAVHA